MLRAGSPERDPKLKLRRSNTKVLYCKLAFLWLRSTYLPAVHWQCQQGHDDIRWLPQPFRKVRHSDRLLFASGKRWIPVLWSPFLRFKNRFPGFGFVTFANPEDAERARVTPGVLDGSTLGADFAVPASEIEASEKHSHRKRSRSRSRSRSPKRTAERANPGHKVFIGALSKAHTTERSFREHVERFGKVLDINLQVTKGAIPSLVFHCLMSVSQAMLSSRLRTKRTLRAALRILDHLTARISTRAQSTHEADRLAVLRDRVVNSLRLLLASAAVAAAAPFRTDLVAVRPSAMLPAATALAHARLRLRAFVAEAEVAVAVAVASASFNQTNDTRLRCSS